MYTFYVCITVWVQPVPVRNWIWCQTLHPGSLLGLTIPGPKTSSHCLRRIVTNSQGILIDWFNLMGVFFFFDKGEGGDFGTFSQTYFNFDTAIFNDFVFLSCYIFAVFQTLVTPVIWMQFYKLYFTWSLLPEIWSTSAVESLEVYLSSRSTSQCFTVI